MKSSACSYIFVLQEAQLEESLLQLQEVQQERDKLLQQVRHQVPRVKGYNITGHQNSLTVQLSSENALTINSIHFSVICTVPDHNSRLKALCIVWFWL